MLEWIGKVTKVLFEAQGMPMNQAVTLCLDCFPMKSVAYIWVNKLLLAHPALTFNELMHAMVHRLLAPGRVDLLPVRCVRGAAYTSGTTGNC